MVLNTREKKICDSNGNYALHFISVHLGWQGQRYNQIRNERIRRSMNVDSITEALEKIHVEGMWPSVEFYSVD